jgi:hypothetical protein
MSDHLRRQLLEMLKLLQGRRHRQRREQLSLQ